MKIQHRVALVTGANRGLGLAYTRALLAAGASKVYAAARDPSTIQLPGVHAIALQSCRQRIAQQIDAGAGDRGDPDARDLAAVDILRTRTRAFDLVDLVIDEDLRDVLCADFLEHALHFLDAPVVFGIGGVNDMQQQVRLARFRQRRFERCDEIMWQIADEADRVGEQHGPAGETVHAAQGRIERGEQLVGRVDTRAGDLVEQRGLAGVGVTDQRRRRHSVALARTLGGVALGFDFFQTLLELLHAPGEQAAVEFELGLAGAAQADRTAALALKVSPAAHEARRHVLELGEFDLQLAFERGCALREDVQDQTRAIDHASTQRFFQIAFLARRQ